MVCRNASDGGHDNTNSVVNKYSYSSGREKESSVSISQKLKNVIKVEESASEGARGSCLIAESDGDITGPETPGTRPLVPRLKRVQEDGCNFGSTTTRSSMDSSKRVKFSDDLLAENRKDDLASEMVSKFDWLHLSNIKDANGRKSNDPLYDKRTLYIPPDVLRKMSASQKQYWSVKSQYMDVLIFFKVVSFCFFEPTIR